MLLMELWEHVTLPQNVLPREEPSEDHVHQDLVSAVSVWLIHVETAPCRPTMSELPEPQIATRSELESPRENNQDKLPILTLTQIQKHHQILFNSDLISKSSRFPILPWEAATMTP